MLEQLIQLEDSCLKTYLHNSLTNKDIQDFNLYYNWAEKFWYMSARVNGEYKLFCEKFEIDTIFEDISKLVWWELSSLQEDNVNFTFHIWDIKFRWNIINSCNNTLIKLSKCDNILLQNIGNVEKIEFYNKNLGVYYSDILEIVYKKDAEKIKNYIKKWTGISIIWGNVFSMKWTILNAIWNCISKNNKKVVSVETPIESINKNLIQLSLNNKDIFKSLKRQDIDFLITWNINDWLEFFNIWVATTVHSTNLNQSIKKVQETGVNMEDINFITFQKAIRVNNQNKNTKYYTNIDDIQILLEKSIHPRLAEATLNRLTELWNIKILKEYNNTDFELVYEVVYHEDLKNIKKDEDIYKKIPMEDKFIYKLLKLYITWKITTEVFSENLDIWLL